MSKHSHDHGHHHAGQSLKVAFFLNLSFTIIEIFGGIWTNSTAILSDAVHDLGDSVSLGLAWYLQHLATRSRDEKFSYGYGRFSLLGAVINSLVLLLGSFLVLKEAIPRILEPEPVHVKGMLGFAILGILVNGAAVLRLKKGSSLNERAAALHLLEDVLGWVAVLVAGVVMLFADVPVLDPLLSVGIVLFVLWNVYRNLRGSLPIFLQGTPANVNLQTVRGKLNQFPEIISHHDIHLWTLDGEYNILTLHVVVEPEKLREAAALKTRLRALLHGLPIHHVTIEVESPEENCGAT